MDTHGLEFLVRKDPLSEGEWCDMIETRRSLIQPYLKNLFQLPKLSAMEHLCTRCSLRFGDPRLIGDREFSLETKGLFNWSSVSLSNTSDDERTLRIWGLTADSDWILAKVLVGSEVRYGNAGYGGGCGDGYQTATNVEIRKTDLHAIIEETKENPQIIWEQLHYAIFRQWELTKNLYAQMLKLAMICKSEECTLSLIPNGLIDRPLEW